MNVVSNKYGFGETEVLAQIPAIYNPRDSNNLVNLYESRVPAGFPSPAENYVQNSIDLHEFLIPRPNSTFLVKVEGESMLGAGILPGSILVVDRSLSAFSGQIVVAILEGEFTVKRFMKDNTGIYLHPENSDYSDIYLSEQSQFEIWGVVTSQIYKYL